MHGCILYWTLRRNGWTPWPAIRSKSEVPKPSTSTWILLMVGGSCRWSPTKVTQASAFIFIKGTKVDSSVAWAASSNKTRAKVKCCINGWSAPEQVAHTTSASLRMLFCLPNCVFGSIPFLKGKLKWRCCTKKWNHDGNKGTNGVWWCMRLRGCLHTSGIKYVSIVSSNHPQMLHLSRTVLTCPSTSKDPTSTGQLSQLSA